MRLGGILCRISMEVIGRSQIIFLDGWPCDPRLPPDLPSMKIRPMPEIGRGIYHRHRVPWDRIPQPPAVPGM